MTQYAKFISNTQIEFPPKNKGSIINYNLDIPQLIADGYKEFVPAEKDPSKVYIITYQETKTQILEIAEEVPQPTPEEQLQQAKQAKSNEASQNAYDFINNGEALYEFQPNKHIEATDGNIGKFTAYALAYVTGQLTPLDTVVWNTKEDETVELTQSQVQEILVGLGNVQANIWTIKYPAYLVQINNATTIEEVDAIIIDYGENNDNQ